MDPEKYWRERSQRSEKQQETSFAQGCYEFLRNKEAKTILEVGCGDGRDTIYFAKKGYVVTAVDVSVIALNILKNKIAIEKINKIEIPITVTNQDIRSLSFAENSFDIIYTHLSLHYFIDKETKNIFKGLYDLLKKGGYIFVKCKSLKDPHFGKGKEIEKNVFNQNGKQRHFFDQQYMKECLTNFNMLSLKKTSGRYSTYEDHTSAFIEAIATK